jgi:hypothetical protein
MATADAVNIAVDWIRLQLLEHGFAVILNPVTPPSREAAARRLDWITDYARACGVPIEEPPFLSEEEASALLASAPDRSDLPRPRVALQLSGAM